MTSVQKSTNDINTIDDALYEYYCTGEIIFNSNVRYRANFEIRMLMNGKIVGDLRFTVNEFFTRSSEQFILMGIINENNLNIIASGCHFTYIQGSSSTNLINCTKVRKLFVSAEGNLIVPKGKLYFGVDVVNVPETFEL